MVCFKQINSKQFCYKVGVMCGNTLYYTMKFNTFKEMVQRLIQIEQTYKSDMQYCTFVIQAYTDNSFDYKNSCFSQIERSVIGIKSKVVDIAEEIVKDYETFEQERSDNNAE